MRITHRCLNQAAAARRLSLRPKSTSFIGLGRMGSEMAFNLFSKQYALANDAHFVVCDAVPAASISFVNNFLSQFPGAQIAIAATPEEATLASSTVVTMLPSSPQVRTVYEDDQGIIPTLKKLSSDPLSPSTFCIDGTTLDVSTAKSVAHAVLQSGSRMVDAPVSGGVTGAKAGTLSFLVGGAKEDFDAAQPLLAHMGQRIIHCGASGSGLAAKIVNNMILGVQQVVVAEGMLLGEKLGLDPAVLASVVGSSTGSCWSMTTNNPVPHALADKSPPCERDYEGGFAMALMLKDMGLASNVGKLSNCPLPLGEAAERIYAAAIEADPGLTKKDFSAIYTRLRSQAGL
ncbi:NAD binding domain of 6-phosphogluconate dehydrogenase-domain-containing protein [Flagelloscypha sp. PMI_526]|nr:NAD binding domain of 6-phosphogluconate dehydrogenase-domain-containing protein [Flagelloscypha sp. PMI_526]